MFDEVTKREGGKRAARRGAYLFGSTAFQITFIAALIFVSNQIRARVSEGPVVDVKFVKVATPPPPPPPPAPPRRKPNAPKPPSDAPKPKPPPPQAMIQPKEVQEEIKLPDPNTKPEPEPEYEGEGEGDGDGVIGGVAGAQGIEEAPQYMSAGYRAPSEKDRGCLGRSVRLPRDLAGIVSKVTFKFSILASGQPRDFQVLTPVPDKRIETAIWNAINACSWSPGADAQGKPIAIWVLQTLRLTEG